MKIKKLKLRFISLQRKDINHTQKGLRGKGDGVWGRGKTAPFLKRGGFPLPQKALKHHFTLIEVVVAVGILMAVMGLAGFAFSSVQSSWRTTSALEQRMKQCQMIDRVLDHAVRNAVPFYWKDRNNKEVMLFLGDEKSVYLTYLHRIGERDAGGIRFLRLYVDGGKLIAEYRQTPILTSEDSGEKEIIADGVRRITFQYADLQDDRLEWYPTWDPEEMKNLPVAILVTVEFADGSREVWLKRTAGNSRNMQWGTRQAVKR